MEARLIEVDWGGGTVGAALEGGTGPVGILLAHGAGAGSRHPWMTAMRSLLAAAVPTMTFDYRYVAEGRRAPDRMPVLLAVHRAAADRMAAVVERVVLAGKSMGGRVGSHLVGDEAWPAAGLVYYGYPLVALGRDEPRDTRHLLAIEAPQLFISGSCDRLGPPALLQSVVAGITRSRLEVVEDADHGFNVPKRSGRTQSEVLASLAANTIQWLGDLDLAGEPPQIGST